VRPNRRNLVAPDNGGYGAIAIDTTTGILHETEDNNPSGFYRFLPNVHDDLTAGGRLQMLAIDRRPNYDTRTRQRVGESLPVRWVDIADPDPTYPTDFDDGAGSLVYQQGFDQGAATFARLEGCWYGERAVYISSTSGGDQGLGQVWEFRPAPSAASSPRRAGPVRQHPDPRPVLRHPRPLVARRGLTRPPHPPSPGWQHPGRGRTGSAPPAAAVALAAPALVLAVACNIAAQHAFASLAFAVRDARSAWFLYQKLVFVLGGMLVPLELLPPWLAAVARSLPFAAMSYAPARLLSREDDPWLPAVQVAWLVVLTGLAALGFALGQRRLQRVGA